MAKKRRQPPTPSASAGSSAPTLKDRLSPDVLSKLKAQAEELKATEAAQQEQRRKEAEEQRKAEQKRLEGDFEYLLNNSSMDWKQHK